MGPKDETRLRQVKATQSPGHENFSYARRVECRISWVSPKNILLPEDCGFHQPQNM